MAVVYSNWCRYRSHMQCMLRTVRFLLLLGRTPELSAGRLKVVHSLEVAAQERNGRHPPLRGPPVILARCIVLPTTAARPDDPDLGLVAPPSPSATLLEPAGALLRRRHKLRGGVVADPVSDASAKAVAAAVAAVASANSAVAVAAAAVEGVAAPTAGLDSIGCCPRRC